MCSAFRRPYDMLRPGVRYRVVRAFTDFDGDVHAPGESWTFLGHNFVPYDDGLSLFVSLEANEEWHIRMQLHEEEQGRIMERFARYVEPVS